MDDQQSGEHTPDDAPIHAGAATGRRTKIIIAAAVAVLVLSLAVAVWRTRSGGGSGHDAAAASGEQTTGADHNSSTTASTGAGRRTSTTSSGAKKPGSGTSATTTPGDTTSANSGGTKPGNTATTRPGVTPPTKPGVTTPASTLPPGVSAAYTDGFNTECRHIWQIADADGLLWDADWLDAGGKPVGVCYLQIDPTDAENYDNVEGARQGGAFDADQAMSDYTLGGVLTNTSQTRKWTGD